VKKSDKIRRFLVKGMKPGQIAERLNVKPAYVHTIKWLDKKAKGKAKAEPERSHNPKVVKAEKKYVKSLKEAFKPGLKPSKLQRAIEQMNQDLAEVRKLDGKLFTPIPVRPKHRLQSSVTTPDLVNKPPHYTDGGVDTLKFIEAKDLNFRLGNVVKYISRAGKKLGTDPVQDLEKALFYLKREIDARKGA